MPNYVDGANILKIELEVAASRVMHQFALYNGDVQTQLENGFAKAIADFDYEAEIYRQAQRIIQESIRKAMTSSKIEELIRQKTDDIVQHYYEMEFKRLKNDE